MQHQCDKCTKMVVFTENLSILKPRLKAFILIIKQSMIADPTNLTFNFTYRLELGKYTQYGLLKHLRTHG